MDWTEVEPKMSLEPGEILFGSAADLENELSNPQSVLALRVAGLHADAAVKFHQVLMAKKIEQETTIRVPSLCVLKLSSAGRP